MFLSLPFLSSQLTRHIVHFCSVSNILDLRIIFHFSFILKFKKKERKKKILTPSSELKSSYLKEIFVENFASLESTLSPSLHLTPRLLNSPLLFSFFFSTSRPFTRCRNFISLRLLLSRTPFSFVADSIIESRRAKSIDRLGSLREFSVVPVVNEKHSK